jgi:hypothetical protein
MKTEDLKALGLTDDQITVVMKDNGIDIKREQDKVAKVELERDNYKGQLDTAQKSLKDFEGIDIKDLKGKIDTLTNDLKTKEMEYQSQLADRDFDSLLDSQITTFGARNSKAVKALLDIETLKASKNQSEDIKKALEASKTENDYLFGSAEPINNAVKSTNGTPPVGDANTNALRAAMGLKPTTE